MGGALAVSLALDSPTRVAGLALMGTGARLRVHPMLLEATRPGGAAAEALTGADVGLVLSGILASAA